MLNTQEGADFVVGLVKEFNEAFDHDPTPETQAKLVVEEAMELVEAALVLEVTPTVETCRDFLKEMADFVYVVAGSIVIQEKYDLEDVKKYIASSEHGRALAVAHSILLDCHERIPDAIIRYAIQEVHWSNMSKLGEGGKPIRNENGKVLKGPNYQEPYLTDLAEELLQLVLEVKNAA